MEAQSYHDGYSMKKSSNEFVWCYIRLNFNFNII